MRVAVHSLLRGGKTHAVAEFVKCGIKTEVTPGTIITIKARKRI